MFHNFVTSERKTRTRIVLFRLSYLGKDILMLLLEENKREYKMSTTITYYSNNNNKKENTKINYILNLFHYIEDIFSNVKMYWKHKKQNTHKLNIGVS